MAPMSRQENPPSLTAKQLRNAPILIIPQKTNGRRRSVRPIAGYLEPISDAEFIFENKIFGGAIATQYISACEKGFKQSMAKGPKLEFPITGVKVVINDGASHAVDSSDMAFQAAARGAFKEAYLRAKPVVHEPIMKVVVETPGRQSRSGNGAFESAPRHGYTARRMKMSCA